LFGEQCPHKLDEMITQRFVIGMLVAPLFAAVFHVILGSTQNYVFGFGFGTRLELGDWVLFVCFYTYPSGWVLGLPSYLVYQWLGMKSLASYLFGGLVGGYVVAAWYVLPFPQLQELWLPMVISASASCGFFWLVAVRQGHTP
jgi:hypothetical protein